MANEYLKEFTQQKYEAGFVTDVETEIIEAGLNEDIIRQISAKKEEPEWSHVNLPEIDYQAISYYADPTKKKDGPKEIDPELMKTFDKLGIPLEERMALAGVAVDAVMDSVSVKTTFKERLQEKGIIFSSFSEAVKENPELVRKYLGTVVSYRDNYFAALNSAVFSDGFIVGEDAEVKYSTVQNWYPGDAEGKGGVLNLVTKRGHLRGKNARLSWTQVETGSAITWKYPSCILAGEGSQAEFYSVAVTNNFQEADTGTKMIHLAPNTRSTIISKGISAGKSQNSYRGLVRMAKKAHGARNYSSCDSLLLSSTCGAHTFPYIDVDNDDSIVEHEATTSKISEDQLLYCQQRGIPVEDAVNLIVGGYAKEVINKLPMEFAVEAQKLLAVSLEGSVG